MYKFILLVLLIIDLSNYQDVDCAFLPWNHLGSHCTPNRVRYPILPFCDRPSFLLSASMLATASCSTTSRLLDDVHGPSALITTNKLFLPAVLLTCRSKSLAQYYSMWKPNAPHHPSCLGLPTIVRSSSYREVSVTARRHPSSPAPSETLTSRTRGSLDHSCSPLCFLCNRLREDHALCEASVYTTLWHETHSLVELSAPLPPPSASLPLGCWLDRKAPSSQSRLVHHPPPGPKRWSRATSTTTP